MQTIGERLEEARKKKGISIREAAEATKIRGDYLQKFESNHFDIGLTEIYTRGFLRTYANFLKVPSDRILSDYAALGRGEVRPRQPNREVYGRMDISVASASEAADRAAPPSPEKAEEPAPARSQPHYPRSGGGSLPTGPDPAVVFKWVKIGGAIVGVIVLVFIIKALFSGGPGKTTQAARPATTASSSAPSNVSAQRTITLVASNPVYVKVQRKNADGTLGEIQYEGMLARNERRGIPWTSALRVTASVCENLSFEINGSVHPMADPSRGLVGYQTGDLPPPAP